MITTELLSEDASSARIAVNVREGTSSTRHEVTVKAGDLARLARSGESAAAFVGRCFEFLLEREAKESILTQFDVMVIARYFPEFERAITAK